MSFECNIETRGRWIRGIAGIVFLGTALVLVFLTPPTGLQRLIVVVLTFAGIFTIFEALKSWCAFRAMGVKTRF